MAGTILTPIDTNVVSSARSTRTNSAEFLQICTQVHNLIRYFFHNLGLRVYLRWQFFPPVCYLQRRFDTTVREIPVRRGTFSEFSQKPLDLI